MPQKPVLRKVLFVDDLICLDIFCYSFVTE